MSAVEVAAAAVDPCCEDTHCEDTVCETDKCHEHPCDEKDAGGHCHEESHPSEDQCEHHEKEPAN
uniref:Uncharacterized protein n=1 Tax=Tetranychus urticae TaxID=32264 RepID=T1K544_TETUR